MQPNLSDHYIVRSRTRRGNWATLGKASQVQDGALELSLTLSPQRPGKLLLFPEPQGPPNADALRADFERAACAYDEALGAFCHTPSLSTHKRLDVATRDKAMALEALIEHALWLPPELQAIRDEAFSPLTERDQCTS